jgi:uncharacterized protein YjbJ (UPF0337 family)
VTTLYDKMEGRTKQLVGELIGDGRLFSEGKQQVRAADVKPKSADLSNEAEFDKARQ